MQKFRKKLTCQFLENPLTNEQTNVQTNEQTNKQMNARKDEQTNTGEIIAPMP